MRKRLVIGAIAVLVIGVGFYFRSQPRKGTLSYHKREYRDAWVRQSQMKNWTGATRLVFQFLWRNPAKRRAFHERALFEKGYLVTRVVQTPKDGQQIFSDIASTISIPGLTWTFISFKADGTNAVVTAPANLIDEIAEVVRNPSESLCP